MKGFEDLVTLSKMVENSPNYRIIKKDGQFYLEKIEEGEQCLIEL